MANFDRAAQRHYRDAVLLRDNGRAANADHLAGFAAECALKAILLPILFSSDLVGLDVTRESAWLDQNYVNVAFAQFVREATELIIGDVGGGM